MEYRYVLSCDAAEFFSTLTVRQREKSLEIFRSLASDPFQVGNTVTKDSIGRDISAQNVRGMGSFVLG
jgi:hypothetical protein